MTPREECREEFEKWLEPDAPRSRYHDADVYQDPWTNARWMAWQAAWNRRPASGEPVAFLHTLYIADHPVRSEITRSIDKPFPEQEYSAYSREPLYRSLPGDAVAMREMVAFLCGEGPLDGVWFGDRHPIYKGAFWWRTRLRAAIDEARGGVGK